MNDKLKVDYLLKYGQKYLIKDKNGEYVETTLEEIEKNFVELNLELSDDDVRRELYKFVNKNLIKKILGDKFFDIEYKNSIISKMEIEYPIVYESFKNEQHSNLINLSRNLTKDGIVRFVGINRDNKSDDLLWIKNVLSKLENNFDLLKSKILEENTVDGIDELLIQISNLAIVIKLIKYDRWKQMI